MSLPTITRTLPALAATAVAMLFGCGDKWVEGRPKPAPVSGRVLHNDQPVAGATVTFVPNGHTHAAAAETDVEGRFQLQTFVPGDGAVPGNYKVTIRKVEIVKAGGVAESDDASLPPPEERWLLPGKYADPSTSDLTVTVPESGSDDLMFELTGAPGAPGRRQERRAGTSGE